MDEPGRAAIGDLCDEPRQRLEGQQPRAPNRQVAQGISDKAHVYTPQSWTFLGAAKGLGSKYAGLSSGQGQFVVPPCFGKGRGFCRLMRLTDGLKEGFDP